VASEGELNVLNNLQRKADAADEMFSRLIEMMNRGKAVTVDNKFNEKITYPSWL
jgi:hypothetical protein